MVTASAFAILILVYMGVTLVWDLCDPDAVKIKFNSNFRLLVASLYVIALIVMSLVVVL